MHQHAEQHGRKSQHIRDPAAYYVIPGSRQGAKERARRVHNLVIHSLHGIPQHEGQMLSVSVPYMSQSGSGDGMEADIHHWLERNQAAYSDSGHTALHCRGGREMSWAANNAFDSILSILNPGISEPRHRNGEKSRAING